MFQPVSIYVKYMLYILLVGKQCLALPVVYQGCFRDASNRTMTAGIEDQNMTIDFCIQHCYGLGYPYAGLQFSRGCYCGDETYQYSKLGKQPEHECNMACSGNQQEICGGSWRNSVYTTAFHSGIFKSSMKLDGFCQSPKGSCTRCAIECMRKLKCTAFRYDDIGCHLISDSDDQKSKGYSEYNLVPHSIT